MVKKDRLIIILMDPLKKNNKKRLTSFLDKDGNFLLDEVMHEVNKIYEKLDPRTNITGIPDYEKNDYFSILKNAQISLEIGFAKDIEPESFAREYGYYLDRIDQARKRVFNIPSLFNA